MRERHPIHAGERTGGQKKGRKGKNRPSRARKDIPHNPNIAEQNGGVKKEQVKGCGSVNRPTPGSQRPAEPVAPGFLKGVKISKNRGQILGLGVKLWVVDDGLSQCRAIPYGVRIGVTTIPAISRASRALGCPPSTIGGAVSPAGSVGSERSPLGTFAPEPLAIFPLLKGRGHLKICAA